MSGSATSRAMSRRCSGPRLGVNAQDDMLRPHLDECPRGVQGRSPVGCRLSAPDLGSEREPGRIASDRLERAHHGVALLREVAKLAGTVAGHQPTIP